MRNNKYNILFVFVLVIALGYWGHYPVPEDATIHRFYFEDTDFDDALELECTTYKFYITNNTHKDIVYMEYQDSKETNYQGMKGEEYDSINKLLLYKI